jgi:Na+-driven multidrug efflux pump
MLAAGSAYLRAVGPFYGFFGLGLSLYFASQGAGRLFWPLFAGLLRIVISVGLGWVVLHFTGSLFWFFLSLGFGLLVYGGVIAAAVSAGTWFRPAKAFG